MDETTKTEKNNKTKNIMIIIFVLIASVIALYFYMESLNYETTDDAYVESDLIPISARVSGQIEEIFIEDNMKINEGDLIAKIDDAEYKIKYEQTKAIYEKALYSQKVAKAKLEAVNSEINAAEKDLNRYKSLYKEGAVSQQTLDYAQIKYDNAKAQLLSAEEDILSDENDKVADANLRALKAEKDRAELNLSYTEIKSPGSGRVTNKNVNKGKFVQVGQPLFTLASDKIWIEANFKETQTSRMKPGMKVEIKTDAYPKKIFKGEIESIQSATGAKSSLFPPENAVGSFVKIVQRVPVKIIFTEEINSEEYNLVTGMSVEPKVRIKK